MWTTPWIYPSSCSPRQDGLDQHSSAASPYDSKTEAFPIIGKLYYLNMTPLRYHREGKFNRTIEKNKKTNLLSLLAALQSHLL